MENFIAGNLQFDFATKPLLPDITNLRRNTSIATWTTYDPTWLVELAREQQPGLEWLHTAFAHCTLYCPESRVYFHFVDPSNPNRPGSKWQFERNIRLESKEFGSIMVDVLTEQRVGGIEFLNRV